MNKKVSVVGLANIAALMAQGQAVLARTAPRVEPVDARAAIAKKTLANLRSFDGSGTATAAMAVDMHNRGVIEAAVREAHKAGRDETLLQNQAVEALLDKQYKARNNLTMPAVVAAVMEQNGMSQMILDLDDVATVFERCKINYTVDATNNLVTYNLDVGEVIPKVPSPVDTNHQLEAYQALTGLVPAATTASRRQKMVDLLTEVHETIDTFRAKIIVRDVGMSPRMSNIHEDRIDAVIAACEAVLKEVKA